MSPRLAEGVWQICGMTVRDTSGVPHLPNGNAVTNLSLATSEQWTDKQLGQKVERTEWHRVSLFGRVAEIAGQYLSKGSQCYIESKLQTHEWEKDGIKRYSTEIIVDINALCSCSVAVRRTATGRLSVQPGGQSTVPAPAATASGRSTTRTTAGRRLRRRWDTVLARSFFDTVNTRSEAIDLASLFCVG